MGADLLQVAQVAATGPAEFLIASAWQGLLLTSGAWIGLKAVPKLAPRTRFVLWMIVFLLAALLPFVTMLHRPAPTSSAIHGAVHFPAAHLDAGWAFLFAGVWLVASLFSLGRLVANAFRLHRVARTATVVDFGEAHSELRPQFEQSGSRSVQLWLSNSIDSPMLIGFFRPAIVVPAWLWQKLTPSEMSQVVMHELAHLERRDDWTNLLQKLFRALFPLNPALLFAERQLCWEREMACDDAVLDGAVTPREYATCLTNLAEKRMLRHAHSLAPGAWRRRSELAERVHRILKGNRTLKTLSARPVILSFLAVYLGAGFILARSPRLVSFSMPPSVTEKAFNTAAVANENEELTGTALNGHTLRYTRGLPAARLEQASFRTVVPKAAAPVIQPKWTPRHAALRHRTAIKREPHVVNASLTENGQAAFSPSKSRGNAGIVFTIFEFSPSVPAYGDSSFSFPQIAAFRSAGGWVIIQL
jgi:beta-lactamase regulating signal transducer with metallopeptidase domain